MTIMRVMTMAMFLPLCLVSSEMLAKFLLIVLTLADLGPSAQTVNVSGPNVDVANSFASQDPHNQANNSQVTNDDETFYYDEATGAVYDAQGHLVEMPPGFDPSSIQMQDTSQSSARTDDFKTVAQNTSIADSPSKVRNGAEPFAVTMHDFGSSQGHMVDPAGQRLQPGSSLSLSRQDSYSSSHRGMETPILSHARSISGFPHMDKVDESPQSRDGSARTENRNVGMTARGEPQLDELGRDQSSILRQRNNRLSHAADAHMSPTHNLHFNMSAPPYEDEMDGKAEYMQNGESIPMQLPPSEDSIGPKGLRMVELEMETEEDSPYPEVRASVSNIDDPSMPSGTFRAWFLAFLLGTIAGAVNVVLNLRYPAPSLTPVVMLLIAYPIGKFMAAVLPIRTITLPRWLGGFDFSLNPGQFNIKEHTLITIVMNLTISQAYGIYATIVLNSPEFYDAKRPVLFSILFVLSSQLLGFSLAGISRRFLVWPASMIWPQNLVLATFLNTLHAEEDESDSSISRFRFFLFVFGGAIIWNFVPGFLFQAVSVFGWLCWIWPNNFVVNTVFGVQTGLGLSVLTFDWNQVNTIGSPLIYPWWSECNIFSGYIIFVCIIAPVIYFTNTLQTSYLPFNTSASYDNMGQPYDISRVLNKDSRLNEQEYESYSPLFLSATYITLFIAGFGSATAVLTHTVLYHGKALWRGIHSIRTEEDDIHAKYMRRYPEVPEWWYATIGVIMFAVAVVAIEVYDTGMPVWALIVSVAIPCLYMLPSGFIYAMTGSIVGTNLIGELVAGYALPGNPIANMIFKVYALQTLSNGLSFVQDLKLGHYMKVPPRQSFCVQLTFSVWVTIVQIGVQQFMLGHVDDLCKFTQEHHFTCPHARVFYTSSVVWGTIGPARLFGNGDLYTPLYWALLIGCFLPFPFWLLARKFPKSWVKYISIPILLNGTTFVPPVGGLVYTSWFTVAFIFQYLIRKYNFRWWSKFNFVTSAALDSGTIVSLIVIFLVLQLPKNGAISLNWWGNTVFQNTLDFSPVAWRQPPEGGFGPKPDA